MLFCDFTVHWGEVRRHPQVGVVKISREVFKMTFLYIKIFEVMKLKKKKKVS